jgi:UDPglucose 6-dehydrogenase
MKVAVIGTGHVGLITCVTAAELGHHVTGVDSDTEKISQLQQGNSPFYEPGLDELLTRHMASGRLKFTAESGEALPEREVVFICVGTPPLANGEANMFAVEMAARDVASHATRGVVVVEKSTVPAGTAERVKITLSRVRPELQFNIASNPEFLREGRAIGDSLRPDRILVGAERRRAFDALRRLYRPLLRQGVPLIETDIATAELAKLACNAFLAMKISFANALAMVCEPAGADVVAATEVMALDPRIGKEFLGAGLGYGGYCFPKDLVAFDRLAGRLGYDFRLLAEVAHINEQAVEATAEKVREALWNLQEKRVALLGLAFKAGTDDTRFSPALNLARSLLAQGARIVGYDPRASANAKAEVPELEVAQDPYEAAWGAHCLVVCTDEKEFRSLDLGTLKEIMFYPIVVDGRNLFDPHRMGEAGFVYYPTGRPAVTPTAASRSAARGRQPPMPRLGSVPFRSGADGDSPSPALNGIRGHGRRPSLNRPGAGPARKS